MNVGIAISGGVDALQDVDTALLAALGFTGVFVGCHEDEVRWQVEKAAGFVRRARADGLEPYAVPWGYGRFLDPDPSIESLYVHTHPDTCQVDSHGRRVRKACPNNPQFLEWFSSSMRTLAWLLECRGFVWDEPGFHHGRGSWSCRCRYCCRLFQAAHGRDMPRELTDEVLEFRRNSVAMFILAAAAAIQSVDRRLGSLVMPSARTPRAQWFTGNEDMPRLAQCSGVDALCVMVPWQEMGWDMEHAVREATERVGRVVRPHGKACILWLTASASPADRTVEAVRFAASAGADAVVLSDYADLIAATGFPFMRDRLREALGEAAS